jgi:hypothetical protein
MAYFKGALATIATMFLAILIPMFWTTFRGLSSEKATGLTVFTAGFLESILSPWFWIFAVLFSVFFYFSGHFDNKVLRILLFWIPTIAASITGFGFWALCTFLALRFGRG